MEKKDLIKKIIELIKIIINLILRGKNINGIAEFIYTNLSSKDSAQLASIIEALEKKIKEMEGPTVPPANGTNSKKQSQPRTQSGRSGGRKP